MIYVNSNTNYTLCIKVAQQFTRPSRCPSAFALGTSLGPREIFWSSGNLLVVGDVHCSAHISLLSAVYVCIEYKSYAKARILTYVDRRQHRHRYAACMLRESGTSDETKAITLAEGKGQTEPMYINYMNFPSFRPHVFPISASRLKALEELPR